MTKRRKLGEETVSRIKARNVTVPFISKIGPMVDRAVFLEALAWRDSARREEIRREAEMLASEARDNLEQLDRQLAQMPPTVLSQTRIVDTRRALVAIVERFDRARTTV